MNGNVRRLFVEKQSEFDLEGKSLYHDLKYILGVSGLTNARVINRYDMAGLEEAEYQAARHIIFSEPMVDHVYEETLQVESGERLFAVEYLPGQYDQRADSAAQCVQILTQKERPAVLSAKVIVLTGEITDQEFTRIKEYCINAVEAREASLDKPASLELTVELPDPVLVIKGFIAMNQSEITVWHKEMGLAMSVEDIAFCQQYFRDTEKRNPTITEIRVIDTYWSDHCRHTTFHTAIDKVEIEPGEFTAPVNSAWQEYLEARREVYGEKQKDICLMDIAVMGMKHLKVQGKLKDLDESEEINACSIVVEAEVNGKTEPWLVMFKNETHNHPTEIEPFGGAATCLGGAIRDPLSGRSYVYQAMRVTGSADPRAKVEDTLPGKLPQRKITVGAAEGYSSYGNQIGLATGQVTELYDPGFVAKRMEIGAVVGAVPRENVVRNIPIAGDVVILIGGRTGRDGCGGATGSSKEHTVESLADCGAEVQKGNPVTERKIQRLFRKPEVSKLIKRCNDFGAGGVSVAIGELTDALVIYLDNVPKKYDGLDGTELAISESQERMAVVVAKEDAEAMIEQAARENLEATVVAVVTDDGRLKMLWQGQEVVNVSRDFLNTNGVKQHTSVKVSAPTEQPYFAQQSCCLEQPEQLKKRWLANLADLNVCSQKGLVERFDSTIGAGTVLLPFGGEQQLTPSEGMVAKLPVLHGETTTATGMTFGYNPQLAKWSPFHGALYAVVEAVTKIVALGGDHRTVRLTLQEYFEKLGKDHTKWGKPFSALLGAFYAQQRLGIAAIGGKDSMSGTFMDLHVPPTLVAFAVDVMKTDRVMSAEFKQTGSQVVLITVPRDRYDMPDFAVMNTNFAVVRELTQQRQLLAAHSVRFGGIAAAVSKMCFGNSIGFRFSDAVAVSELFCVDYGALVLELPAQADAASLLKGANWKLLGHTQEQTTIAIGGVTIRITEAQQAWQEPLEDIFPTTAGAIAGKAQTVRYDKSVSHRPKVKVAKPRVFIPVFPGTNCEYDSAKAFERAGAVVDTMVVRNMTPADIEQSVERLTKGIGQAQIVMLPGGFSAGDEPDGSGKFIAAMFRNAKIKEAVSQLLKQRDGLMLGICNGFQALIKLGLVPYGEIVDLKPECPTLTFNQIGRHVSCMVRTRISSVMSPWFHNVRLGDMHTIAVSHGEGRFVGSEAVLSELIQNGQIATQYVDLVGEATYDIAYNPNGSMMAIEGITSPDGRVLGKMGHSERIGSDVAVNVPGAKDQKLFEAGVEYFG